MSRTAACLALLLLAVLAGYLRFTHLETRPMHTDEATNTLIFRQLLEGPGYRYRPEDYHGPALHYLTWLAYHLQGTESFVASTKATYRRIPAAFGLMTVLLMLAFRKGLTTAAALAAAALAAVSPICVFYSRYFIHETIYVFVIGLTFLAGWAYLARPGLLRAAALGLAIGFMHAFKETCVIAWAAMAAGAVLVYLTTPPHRRWRWNPTHLAVALAAALAVWVTFYSSLFTWWPGLLDSLRAYWLYRHRAATVHQHPWWFYLHRLFWFANPPLKIVWTEALIGALALVGTAAAALGRAPRSMSVGLLRFLAVYAFGSLAAFSAIGYKTPWNGLPVMLGLILLAGAGTAALLDWLRHPALRLALAVALAAGLVHLTGLARITISPRFEYDRRNPYVYAHTVKDIERLTARIEQVAAVCPDGHDMPIQVFTDAFNYWPLPWELRAFTTVGYYHRQVTPLLAQLESIGPQRPLPPHLADILLSRLLPDVPVVITEPKLLPVFQARLGDRYVGQFFGLRPGVNLLCLLRADLWNKVLAGLQNPTGHPPPSSP